MLEWCTWTSASRFNQNVIISSEERSENHNKNNKIQMFFWGGWKAPLFDQLDILTLWTPTKTRDSDNSDQVNMSPHLAFRHRCEIQACNTCRPSAAVKGEREGICAKGAYLSSCSSSIKCCDGRRTRTFCCSTELPNSLLSHSPYSLPASFWKPWELHTALESKWNKISVSVNISVNIFFFLLFPICGVFWS